MSSEVNEGRRTFLIGSSVAVAAVGAGFTAVPFVKSWNPSAKAQSAGAPVVIDVSKLEPGKMIKDMWRGKPVWVVRRTPEALESLDKLEGELRDPESDEGQQPDYARNKNRSIKPEYLVLIGICTHLGCSPKYRPDPDLEIKMEYGGFFCPCHGSRFDFSGRVYKGVPAPTNLEVPPHSYMAENENLLVIGVEAEEVA